MQPVRTGVFDEHEIFRRGMVASLVDDPLIELVAEGHELEAADLDVAVVSARLLRRVTESQSGGPVPWPLVVCSASGDPLPLLPQVMAVLPRADLSPDRLVSAVRAAAVGLRISALEEPKSLGDERGLRVLVMLADGLETRDISRALGYSERTVKSLIATVNRELGARNRAQAVAEAIRRSLI